MLQGATIVVSKASQKKHLVTKDLDFRDQICVSGEAGCQKTISENLELGVLSVHSSYNITSSPCQEK